jgi:predicted amidophosphoribosyltransferase
MEQTKLLQDIVSESIAGFKSMLFPDVCLSCGDPGIQGGSMLCPFCQESQFDSANPFNSTSCPGVILPEGIRFQFALWKYDKGGVLQKLLHSIKYGGMGKLGFELGQLTANALLSQHWWHSVSQNMDIVLLPIPLHPKKKRMRGFNQAEVIAMGMSNVLGIETVEEGLVLRTRFTNTQTGHSLLGRLNNLKDAFQITDWSKLSDKYIIIVDDVFTTGATTFALASAFEHCGVAGLGITTVAFA